MKGIVKASLEAFDRQLGNCSKLADAFILDVDQLPLYELAGKEIYDGDYLKKRKRYPEEHPLTLLQVTIGDFKDKETNYAAPAK